VVSAPIPAPSTLAPGLPAEFDRIVARGLARDPLERFPTAREMALALEECAPQIRPSEIASWVERIAADSLARRSLLLSAIEHSPHDSVDGEGRTEHVDMRALAAAQDGSGRRSVPSGGPMLTPGTGMNKQRYAPHPGVQEDLASVRERPQAPKSSRATKLLGLAVLVISVLVGLFLLVIPSGERERPIAAPLADEGTLQVRSGAADAAASAPQATRPTATPSPASTVQLKEVVTEEREREREKPASRSAPKSERKSRSTRAPKAPSCDPPYSIDASGRRIFKVECM
jgi:hypothetical protein